jgi:hypothetical protein
MTQAFLFRALDWFDEHAEVTCVVMVALMVALVGLAPAGMR